MEDDLNNKKFNIVIPLLGVSRGGGIRVLIELANGLTLRGHKIILITPPIDFFPFPLDNKVKLISRLKNSMESNLAGRLKDYIFIYKNSSKAGDIILSNYYATFFIGCVLKIFTGMKHVYFIQGYEAEFFNKKQNISNKIKNIFAKFTYKIKPDLRITISQFIKDKIGKKDIIIINDGIDLRIFKPANKKVKGQKKVICTIALTEVRKGFYDFVRAIEILSKKRSDFEILLFTSQGDAKFDLTFPFTIKYPSNDLEVVNCMQNSDIFISASHLEGFGLPGLEAMACGTALITTNSGGITQYAVNEVNALIVNIGDIDGLVKAIERMLDEPYLRNRISEAGLVTSKMFTWDLMCENFENELIKL